MFPLGFCMENGKLWFCVCRTPKAPDSLMGCHLCWSTEPSFFAVLHTEMLSTTCVAAQLPPGLCLSCKYNPDGRGCSWGHRAPRRSCAPSHWSGCFVPAGEPAHHGYEGIKLPFLILWLKSLWSFTWIQEIFPGKKVEGTAVPQGVKGCRALLLVFDLSGSDWWYTEVNSVFLPSLWNCFTAALQCFGVFCQAGVVCHPGKQLPLLSRSMCCSN